jgi:chorismate synthase
MDTLENASLKVEGRHAPCIVHRAVPVIEAAAALATCELLGI